MGVLLKTLVKNGIHIILLIMGIENGSWMIVKCGDLEIVLPIETKLALYCEDCQKLLYYTDKDNEITSRVFNQVCNHRYFFYSSHRLIKITRNDEATKLWMQLVKDPPFETAHLTEEDNI